MAEVELDDADEDDVGLQIEFEGNEGQRRFTWEGMVRNAGAPASLGVGTGSGSIGTGGAVGASRAAADFFGGGQTEEERQTLRHRIGAVAAGHAERVELSKT